ncbi:MAG: heavy metal translocating P-type ATPase [Bergeyella sp.]|nr:heavy metal translocating P-type ATPase [Bergeyella sp.]
MKREYILRGMSCLGCKKKISEGLSEFGQIRDFSIDFEHSTIEIEEGESFNLEKLNEILKRLGDYEILPVGFASVRQPAYQEHAISPSSVYYCPMQCEGDKVYFDSGLRCPVCKMYLVPIENKKKSRDFITPTTTEKEPKNKNEAGRYYCPMFCEGNKTYEKNIGCPVCGMDLVKITSEKHSREGGEGTYKILKRKFYWALAFAIPVFTLSMGAMLFHFHLLQSVQRGLEFLLTLPVFFYSGGFILKRGYRSFRTLNLNMFSLIFLGVGVAFVFSTGVLVFSEYIPNRLYSSGYLPVYFESVVAIITLVIFGQMLEAKAHEKTNKAVEKLMNLAPETAHKITGNKETEVKISEIKVGDTLRIRPGDKIPADGKITEGQSTVDESMMTGEHLPVDKKKNDSVKAGTLNLEGTFIMLVETVGEETLLARVIKMVNEASRSKAPIQNLADKVSKIFVPIVILISVLTFLGWLFWGKENVWALALMNAVSVLIIACPCALGLATPMSLMVGLGKGAEHGILIKNASALEQMNRLDVLFTDKTGTLTVGRPKIKSIKTIGNFTVKEMLEIAVALSKNSTHPLSIAVRDYAIGERINDSNIEDFKNSIGQGLVGKINGEEVFMGNERLLASMGISLPKKDMEEIIRNDKKMGDTVSYIGRSKKVLGILSFSDEIKSFAKKSIDYLRRNKVKVVMLTGDTEASAKRVAGELGIREYRAQCLPEDKIQEISKYQKNGKIVAMAGDGINDAPALTKADIGIAMGTGSDIAIESAEITLLKGDITGVVKAKILSKKLLTNIKQNLYFAFLYNVLGIPIAAGLLYPLFGILLSPEMAAVAMSLSSVSVIINALRLRKTELYIDS